MTRTIENGGISIEENSYSPGSMIAYSCNKGFSSRDVFVTECQDIFLTWTLDNTPPTCKRSTFLALFT